jgi:hypothetical protein
LNPTRRNLWIAGAAVVVIAAGAFGYFTWAQGSGGIDASGKVAMRDLLQPGPCPTWRWATPMRRSPSSNMPR